MVRTHARHVYYRHHPRDFANEYTVYSGRPGEDLPGHRIPRDQALEDARWVNDHDGATAVTVDPCPCHDCALATYAEDHPRSVLANRVRNAKTSPAPSRRDYPKDGGA